MKRSEMVLHIANQLIREELGFPAFDVAQDIAQEILDKMEAKGMKPPYYENEYGVMIDRWESE